MRMPQLPMLLTKTLANSGGGESIISVNSITLSRSTSGKNRERANAVVAIIDDSGNPIANDQLMVNSWSNIK